MRVGLGANTSNARAVSQIRVCVRAQMQVVRMVTGFPDRLELLVVPVRFGRDSSQPPGMQEAPQGPVPGRIVGGVHGLVILTQKLSPFLLRQVAENHLRVIRVLVPNQLSRHVIQATCPDCRRSAGRASRCQVRRGCPVTHSGVWVSVHPGASALAGAGRRQGAA